MKRISSDEPMPSALRGAVIALGNFDGFHAGHQAVIGRAIALAHAEGRPAIVGTFDPHPARLFQPDAPPFRLTTLDQREQLFADAGVDAMLVFHFNAELAARSAEEFVVMLAQTLGAVAVVTGADFTFGKGRSGDVHMLSDLGAAHGLRALTVPAVHDEEGAIISSSRIRAALARGDCAGATHLLTRPFTLRGEIVHGDKLGREIGFPTANMMLGNYVRPAYGIYAVMARLPDGRVLPGAANLGIRPTFDPPKELFETYIFDFAEDLYGQTIDVGLIEFLRGEGKFDSLETMVAQIDKDVQHAREILKDQVGFKVA